MPGKKSGLGKGLDSLIPNKKNDISDSKVEKKQEKENDSPKSGEIMVRINEVEPNRDQPRKDFDEDALMELADSIRQFGILQPLLVQKKKNYDIKRRNWSMATLKDAKIGQTVRVKKLTGEGAVKRRIMDMGITKGVEVYIRKVAPLGDPIEITVRGYELSLRKADAELIEVE